MYFFGRKKLIARLAQGSLTPGEDLGYLIGFLLYEAMVTVLSLPLAPKARPFHFLEGLGYSMLVTFAMTGVTILALLILYVANGGARQKNFLSTLVSLRFVTTFQFAIPMFLVLVANAVNQYFTFDAFPVTDKLALLVMQTGLWLPLAAIPILQFFLLWQSVRQLSKLRG